MADYKVALYKYTPRQDERVIFMAFNPQKVNGFQKNAEFHSRIPGKQIEYKKRKK